MTIREAREKKGMTQQELAKAVGVKAVSICRYELGQRAPRPAVAKKLGVILEKSEDVDCQWIGQNNQCILQRCPFYREK